MAFVSERGNQKVSIVVGEEVEHYDAARRAYGYQIGLVVGGGQGGADKTAGRLLRGRLTDVWGAPRRPKLIHGNGNAVRDSVPISWVGARPGAPGRPLTLYFRHLP